MDNQRLALVASGIALLALLAGTAAIFTGRSDRVASQSVIKDRPIARIGRAKMDARTRTMVAMRDAGGEVEPDPDTDARRAVHPRRIDPAIPAELAVDVDEDAASSIFPLDPRGIREAVAERYEDLKGCYETHLHHTPDLGGRVVLAFDIEAIAADGEGVARVTNVDIAESELDATFLEGCIVTVFSELRFEAPETGKTTVNYPVFLSNED